MLNFLNVEYPYGNSEAFIEYEMRELGEAYSEPFNIFVFKGNENSKKRFVPDNAKIIFMKNRSLIVLMIAFFRLFKKSSLKEILFVLKKKPADGILRCFIRIYRYITVAVGFERQYRSLGQTDGKNIFVSYWLNECAFALTELKKRFPEIRIASRGHGFDVFEERCYLPFRKEILNGLDKIYLINHASKQYFKEHYGSWLDISKIEIAHLGVDLHENKNVDIKAGVFRVVTCSSVIPLKRIDLMIDALSGIKDKKIEWVHLGGGPLLENMKEYAENKLKDSSVDYSFMGQLPLSQVHEYYKQKHIDVFVNCSDTEGTPVSVMEAMSYGIPAVARNVGGMEEVLDNKCGILLPTEENAELLRKAILDIYSLSNDDYLLMSQNAEQKIKNEFNASVTFKSYIEDVCSL